MASVFHKRNNTILYVVGLVFLALALFTIIPLIAALFFNDSLIPYLIPLGICSILAILFLLSFKPGEEFKPTTGVITLTLAWLIVFTFGTLPYIGFGMSVADAIFESVSGFTTTGATIMPDVEVWPKSLLIWRSLTQWGGGIGIILVFMLLLPMMGFGGRMFINNELSGSGGKNFSTRLKDAAKQFMVIYFALSTIMIVLLLILGVNLYEALCMMMSTISTGGFMCLSSSIMDYNDIIQGVVILFMFLGGINFYLHYKAVYNKDFKAYIHNGEFLVMLGWYLIATLILCLIIGATDPSLIEDVLFTVVSLGTTTGFATIDYAVWPTTALALILAVMFIGGSAGSTSGGLKISRIIIAYKYVRNAVRSIINPRVVSNVRINKENIDHGSVSVSLTVFLLFVVTISITALVLIFSGIDVVESWGVAFAMVTNVGPAIGIFGPYGSFESMEDWIKIFLSVVMWIGRLEIATALILFMPGFWREYSLGTGKKNSRLRKILYK